MKLIKQISLIISLCFFCNVVCAQNNLQFSKAIFIPLICPAPSGFTTCTADTILIVPSNKVWKIESCGGQGKIKLNNAMIFCSYDCSIPIISFPIWLMSGTYMLSSGAGCGGCGFSGFISAIEFNLVP